MNVTKIEGSGRRVLVVDDDLAIRVLLDAVLKRMGFEVMLAADGPRALELSERYDFDLILLDLLMPVLDGEDVLRRLDSHKRPHIIVFTGSERGRQFSRNEVCDAIVKPFDLELFTRTVAHCIDGNHQPVAGPSSSFSAAEKE